MRPLRRYVPECPVSFSVALLQLFLPIFLTFSSVFVSLSLCFLFSLPSFFFISSLLSI
jgi:hypothetical protein